MRRSGKTSSSFSCTGSAVACLPIAPEWARDQQPTPFDFLESLAMMVLYSGTTCPFSHRCRFVLFEKGMDFEIRDVDLYNKPEDISVMNPYGQVPILVERDLILYESNIINEYIDERFPHPQAHAG